MSAALRTEDVTAFHGAAEFTGVTSKNRAGWLALRKTMLTASDVASVLNLDDDAPAFRKSALAVYVEKVTDPQPDLMDLTPAELRAMPPARRAELLRLIFNDPRFWGSKLEQAYLTTVAEYSSWTYREGGALLRSRKHPWLGCTLDAEIDRDDGLGWVDCEGKSTKIPKGWDEDTGSLPTHIIIQAQAQLMVTGAPVALVVALLQGSRLVQIPIDPDERMHAIFAEEGERFMERVRLLDPPPPDWRESSTDALGRLYPGEDGAVVDLPAECVEWTRELHAIAEQLKTLERRDTQIRNMLKHKIGPASFGTLAEPVDDKAGWSWKTNKAGQRVLRALKRTPVGARVYGLNGPAVANDDSIIGDLEESLAEDGTAPVIRFPGKRQQKRRSSRR